MNIFGTITALMLIMEGQSTTSAEEDTLITDLVKWMNENGAYINEKVAVKRSDGVLGLVATADMAAEEIICHIPSTLILMPDKKYNKEMTDSLTIQKTYKLLTEKEPNPWARYLLSQPHRYTPEFWTKAGRSMLKRLTGETLPPQYFEETLEELEEYGGDIKDEMYLHAAMLVKSRADYNFLVPFYDMTNHHNGKVNMKHVYNPYEDDIKETGYAIATTRAVSSGEQLYNSYNQGNISGEYFDWFGTPEMFQCYGFIEKYPQRWLFDLSRIKFDLDLDSKGEAIVTFLAPPSKKGLAMLQTEMERLDEFSKQYRSKSVVGMPENEWIALWQYYDALYFALSSAVNSNAACSEDIWKAPHDWWVKDGTLRESDREEHYVHRSV